MPTLRNPLVASGIFLILALPACGGGSGTLPPPPPDITTGLVASWLCDGTTADAVGGADGTPTGGFSYGTDRFGNANSTWTFDGASARVDVGASAFTLLASEKGMSISFWCRTSALSFFGAIIHGDLFVCRDAFKFTMIRGATNTISDVMPDDAWTHFVCTYDNVSDVMVIYRDGLPRVSDLKGGTLGGWGLNYIKFGQGSYPSADYWAGQLDDVRLYDRPLSEADVLELYQVQKAN